MSPQALKVVDDKGNTLTPVNAGDGSGYSLNAAQVFEFAGMSPDAQSVTFTPMRQTFDWVAASVEERQVRNESNAQHVDVSQIGTKLATSEFGGYELTGRDVSNSTVTISLKPYGWQAMGGYMELIPEQEVTYLASEFTNLDGQSGVGYHSAIVYRKWDYMTGNLVLISSYYAATDEELQGLTQYGYHSAFGEYQEDIAAARTTPFVEGA